MPRLFLKLALAGKIKKRTRSRRTRFPGHADFGEVLIVPHVASESGSDDAEAELNHGQRANSDDEQVADAEQVEQVADAEQVEQVPVAEQRGFFRTQESIEEFRILRQLFQLHEDVELSDLENLETQISKLTEEISITLEAQIGDVVEHARHEGSSSGTQDLKDTLEGFANMFGDTILPVYLNTLKDYTLELEEFKGLASLVFESV